MRPDLTQVPKSLKPRRVSVLGQTAAPKPAATYHGTLPVGSSHDFARSGLFKILIVLAILLVLWAAGKAFNAPDARPDPRTIPLPVGEVYKRLMASTLDELIADKGCGFPLDVEVAGVRNRVVVYQVNMGDKTFAQMTARLTPVGAQHTRLDTTVRERKMEGPIKEVGAVLNGPVKIAFFEQAYSDAMGIPYADVQFEYEFYRSFKDSSHKFCDMTREEIGSYNSAIPGTIEAR